MNTDEAGALVSAQQRAMSDPHLLESIESAIREATDEANREAYAKALELVTARWAFDDNQQHRHTWHDMQDVRAELSRLANERKDN